jgi:hypothetical protein
VTPFSSSVFWIGSHFYLEYSLISSPFYRIVSLYYSAVSEVLETRLEVEAEISAYFVKP